MTMPLLVSLTWASKGNELFYDQSIPVITFKVFLHEPPFHEHSSILLQETFLEHVKLQHLKIHLVWNGINFVYFCLQKYNFLPSNEH